MSNKKGLIGLPLMIPLRAFPLPLQGITGDFTSYQFSEIGQAISTGSNYISLSSASDWSFRNLNNTLLLILFSIPLLLLSWLIIRFINCRHPELFSSIPLLSLKQNKMLGSINVTEVRAFGADSLPPQPIGKLIIEKSLDLGRQKEEVVVRESPFTIGRRSCNLTLGDAYLSRRHAQIILENSRLYLKDLSSNNGTFIGEKRLLAQTATELALDRVTKIRLGPETILVFWPKTGVADELAAQFGEKVEIPNK